VLARNRGDSRTAHFEEPWPVRIHPGTLHYIGPAAFAPPDITAGYAERILELLCKTFPEEVSRMHTFRSVHFQQASVPLPYACVADRVSQQAQSRQPSEGNADAKP